MIKASIIAVGDEILKGQIYERNSSYIANQLFNLGIVPLRISAVGDNREVIREEIAYHLKFSDVIFITGGLGPTPDDLTKEVVSEIFKKNLLLDETTLKKIEEWYKRMNTPVPDEATKQALYPRGSLLLENPVGICPGLILKEKDKYLILLPGIPTELQKVFETGVLPFLETQFPLKPLFHSLIRTTGITESEIMEKISRIASKKFRDCLIKYQPSHLGVDISVITEKDKNRLLECAAEIKSRLTPFVYAVGNKTLEERIGEILRQRKWTIATAESCTGGLVGDRITNAIGSSDYFVGGVVAYSDEIKKLILGVREETLKKYGAVSKETVSEMAIGVREHFKANIGLALSGIAGPTGGTPIKPVGLVYIGLSTIKKNTYKECHFSGNRWLIKEIAAQTALDLLRRYLEGYD